MSDYYSTTGFPGSSAQIDSAPFKNEYAAIDAGFAKVAPLTGNGGLPVFINSAGSAQEAVSVSSARTKLGVQAYSAALDTYGGIAPSANVQALLGSADYAAFRSLVSVYSKIEGDAAYMLISNIGTAANNYLQLNASGQIPAVDGSLLTGIAPADGSITTAKLAAECVTPYNLEDSALLNRRLTVSRASGAETITFNGKGYADFSATNLETLVCRNDTLGVGGSSFRSITTPTWITIPSGATLGASDGVPFRIWILSRPDGGYLAAINTKMTDGIYPLFDNDLYDTVAIDATAGSAGVFYSDGVQSAIAMRIIGFLDYTLPVAGTWDTAPTRIQLFDQGMPLPGTTIQTRRNSTGAYAAGTTIIPVDDTIPQVTEGFQIMSQTIVPKFESSVLRINSSISVSASALARCSLALFKDGASDALSARTQKITSIQRTMILSHTELASTAVSQTWTTRIGPDDAKTVYFNGYLGARFFGGVMESYINIDEIMV